MEEDLTGPEVITEWVVSICLRREEVRSEANQVLPAGEVEMGSVRSGRVGQAGRSAKWWLLIWDMECLHAAGFFMAMAAPISARSFPTTPQCEGTFCKCVWKPR